MLLDVGFSRRVFAYLAAEVDGIVMDDNATHALLGLDAFDHKFINVLDCLYERSKLVASVRMSSTLSR